ncbi:MAG: nuclear transport factor 2 family protein [Gammaproteobacteria bacterium]|nr:MAG: nuclear transport factor 2 family protein [Gammaproteobacteria bacterium]
MSKIFPTIYILLVGIILHPTILLADPESNCSAYSNVEQNNIKLIKSIFVKLWETGKNESDFSKIYSEDFIFYGNGSTENYVKFKRHMSKNVDYWDWKRIKFNDIFAHGDKVIARIDVIGKSKKGKVYELDSMELFQIKNNKIVRWWETSYPDWQQMIKESGESY